MRYLAGLGPLPAGTPPPLAEPACHSAGEGSSATALGWASRFGQRIPLRRRGCGVVRREEDRRWHGRGRVAARAYSHAARRPPVPSTHLSLSISFAQQARLSFYIPPFGRTRSTAPPPARHPRPRNRRLGRGGGGAIRSQLPSASGSERVGSGSSGAGRQVWAACVMAGGKDSMRMDGQCPRRRWLDDGLPFTL